MTSGDSIINWLGQYPEVLAVLIVAAGWVLARLMRSAVMALVPWLNKTLARFGAGGSAIITPVFSRALQFVVFWGILISALVLGLQLMGGGELSSWPERVLGLVSQLMVALGIVAAGHLLGLLARSLTARLAHGQEAGVVPRLAYVVVLSIALVTALEHLGLNISFATHLVLVVLTVLLAGLALAFAMGAKTLVSNLAAQGELQRYKPGDRLSVNGVEGTVVEIHKTGLVLSTEQGLAAVPASKFAENIVTLSHPDTETDD